MTAKKEGARREPGASHQTTTASETIPPQKDAILETLARAHRAVLGAGQSWLDQDRDRLLKQLDQAVDACVAVAQEIRS